MDESTSPGFTSDPENPNFGTLTDPTGQGQRVYVKRSRKPTRHAAEKYALELLNQRGLPVPRLLGEWADEAGAVMLLSYEEGVNLADLLTPTPAAPPRPTWYQPAGLARRPSIGELASLLTEIGCAVRGLHAIHLGQFGRLAAPEPNPHCGDARAFTLQEFKRALQMGLANTFLPPDLAHSTQDWFTQEIGCLSETEPPCFVHYDLHAGNIRVFCDPSSSTWRLRALFDFELSRAWLPEWDLANLHLDLKFLKDAEIAWSSFLDGYGAVDSVRLRLFECLRAVAIIAYADRYPEWGAWSLEFLTRRFTI